MQGIPSGYARKGRFPFKQPCVILICLIMMLTSLFFLTSIDRRRRRPVNPTTLNIHQTIVYSKSIDANPCDNAMKSPRGLDIVLSYYSEDVNYVARFIEYLRNVSNLQKLHPRFIVYNKNPQIDNEILRNQLEVDMVQSLVNIGREGGTYLYHIIENYDTLSNHTLFCQAGVEGITSTHLADWFQDRLEHQFNSSVGYMPLVSNSMITTYHCDPFRTGPFSRLAELWAMLDQTICPPKGYAIAYRGQFLVSNRRIRSRPLQTYKYLYELISADRRHWLHREIHSLFFKSTPDNPIFGHIIERAWTILFRCTKPDLYDRCRKKQCACFDES